MFERKWNIRKLYLAYPALLTRDSRCFKFYYNEACEIPEPIVVKKINSKFVKNVLTNKNYAIFKKIDYLKCLDYVGEYVVGNLTPLESLDMFKGKTTISKTELRQMLTPRNDENSDEIKEPFLVCILETVEKVKKSDLSLEEKTKLASELTTLLDYYKSGLERIKKFDNDIKLTSVPNTLLSLREECLMMLTKIEESIPSDLENNSDNDFKILRKKIDSLM